MSFPGIFGGFETHQKQFFEIFEAKEQKESKNRKFWKISGKYRKLSGKIGQRKFRWRLFPGFINDIKYKLRVDVNETWLNN